jgi:hypothetical protein
MKRIHLIVLGIFITVISPFSFFSAAIAQARQCSTARPPDARSHWSYRLIDGRKCWYEGKPMLSKSLLDWPPTQAAENPGQEPSFPSSKSFNFLDAQASMPNNADSFEARWRERFIEAIGK